MPLWDDFREMCNAKGGELKEEALGTANCVYPNGCLTLFNTGNGIEIMVTKDNDTLDLVSRNLKIREGFLGRKEFYGKEGVMEVDIGPVRINHVHIRDKDKNVSGSLW